MSGQSRAGRAVPGLTVCGSCSGETLGDSDLLSGGQLARIQAIEIAQDATLTVVDCLDECERGDVVAVRPVAAFRSVQGPVWFERLAGEELSGELHAWVRAGGPGVADVPGRLAPLVIDR